MKYLCPSCDRLVAPAQAWIKDARLEILCPKCGATESLDITAMPQSSAPKGRPPNTPPPDAPRCPKCGEPHQEVDACSRCGLVFEKWRPTPSDEPPPHLGERWADLQERWDDEALHDEFTQAAFESESLSFAARCYRSRDDERSRRQLEKLTTLGVEAMRGAELPTAFTPRIGRVIGWVTFVLLCLTLAALAFLATR
jgi:rubredoxin